MSGTLQRMWAYPSETCLWEVSQNIRQTCSLCREDFDHDHFAQQTKNLVEARAIEIPSVEGTWTWCIGSINLLSQYVHLEYVPIVALKHTFQPPLSCGSSLGNSKESIYSITDVHYTINPKAVPKKEERVHNGPLRSVHRIFVPTILGAWTGALPGPSESQSYRWRGPSFGGKICWNRHP